MVLHKIKPLNIKNNLKEHKKTLKLIPFFFTFSNALLGALAVLKGIDDQFIVAVYCILLAAFMDTLDGRLARFFNSTSGLGAELDSLCDAISFCLAPVILLYSWGLSSFGTLGLAVLGMYLCAGLFRLARFNAFHKDTTSFLGLPTPMAAFFLLSFILYKDWFENSSFNFIFDKLLFCIIIVFIAVLMISNIPFPSFKYSNNNKVKWVLVFLIPLFIIAFFKQYPVLFFAPLIYIFSGIFYISYKKLKNFTLNTF